ncbi:MAG: tetratricopeptide repeat protein [Chitinophagales bacterium]|nr:tetratricopeptide repeat protein [Chitinophagales bacterium]
MITIAVLPFVNMSTGRDDEYFSDGITEEIINALAQIEQLKVTSRTSSFFFKNKKLPLTEVGKLLNVSVILEGSIRIFNNKVRITAQLIDADSDFYFWSETFDRSLEDIFAVQDEISLLIADKIRENIGHLSLKEHLVTPPHISTKNYQEYLKGKYLIQSMIASSIFEGISILEKITREAPQFPYAHLSIHLGYNILATTGGLAPQEAFAKGNPYLTTAMKIDDNLPECHHYIAGIAFWQKWDLKDAFKHLNKAIAINPSYADAHQSMAPLLCIIGKYEAALSYINSAIQLDPFSPMNHYLKGVVYYVQEKYKDASKFFKKSIELAPDFLPALINLGNLLLLEKKMDEAKTLFQKLPPEGLGEVAKIGGEALIDALENRTEQAELKIEKLKTLLQSGMKDRVLFFLAQIQCALGDYEAAISLLRQGIEERIPYMIMIDLEPFFKPLHAYQSYQDVIAQLPVSKEESIELPRKYMKSSLKEEDIQAYLNRLEMLMVNRKPYLQALSLRQLAQMTDIHPNQLSQLINEHIGQRFSDYVNAYRLKHFKSLVGQAENRHLTLLALAYESGFNSKTVFNTFFKKATGKTPKAYWNEIIGS